MSLSLLFLMLIQAIKLLASGNYRQSNPNIIFILTDDWGNNDVGWTNGNTDIQTPFLDKLAQTESVILSNHYVERVCTATRASLLTGRYPSRYGLQAGVFHQNQPFSLTRQVSMLSNEFQSNGYATHIIGKWHLGYQSYEYTPTYRGFDTFYGFWNGGADYYTHTSSMHYDDDLGPPMTANDFYVNDQPAVNNPYNGIYGVWWQRDEALNLLRYYAQHQNHPPFFFYFALQASHNPREAPLEYTNLYINGKDEGNMDRITAKAQATTVDDAMSDIIGYIKDSGLWDNTLIVFSSDNGGKEGIGDNAPYRGFKNTSWEGGVKVPAFVTGGALNDDRRGTILTYSMHITDWYSTLITAAGLNVNYMRSTKLYSVNPRINIVDYRWKDTTELQLDGMDMWSYIQDGVIDDEYFENEREILLDLNDVWCLYSSCGALRIGRYKYIRGDNIATLLPDYDGANWDRSYVLDADVAEIWCTAKTDPFREYHGVTFDDDSMINSVGCQGTERGCLFDLDLDPCEYYDLSNVYPDLLHVFQDRLDEFQDEATVALMGENNDNEVLDKDMINPMKVCVNTMYWCPYQSYDSVTWENTLFNNNNVNDTEYVDDKEDLSVWVYMFLWMYVCIGMLFVCKHERNKQNEHFVNQNNHLNLHEMQPLVVH